MGGETIFAAVPCHGCVASAFCPLVLPSAMQGTSPSSLGSFFWEQKCSSAGVCCVSNARAQPSYLQIAFWGEGLLNQIELKNKSTSTVTAKETKQVLGNNTEL